MSDHFTDTFVTVKPSVVAPDPLDGVRAQVVATRGDLLTIRYANGTHRPIQASQVIMEADQTTPVWPPVA